MLQKLNQPFPDKADFKQSLLSIFWVGIFVGLFLFLIRPFGIEGTWADIATASAGFGGITILFGWVYESATRFVFRIKTYGPQWTLGKWMLYSIVLIVWIAIGNYLFVNWLTNWKALDYFYFTRMVGYTSLIGIFPIALSGLVVQMRAEKENELDARSLDEKVHAPHSSQSDELVVLDATENEFKFNSHEFRYAEAMQNYVTIWFVRSGALQKEILRSTVASLEEQLTNSPIIRCHRSYLVNPNSIEKVGGNAQGLRLNLRDVPQEEVPVSRSYISKIREVLD